LKEGIKRAAAVIDSGLALNKLEALKELSNSF
jgi:anthranilate phosphoribosyltransferase